MQPLRAPVTSYGNHDLSKHCDEWQRVRPQQRMVEMHPEYAVLSPQAYRVLWVLRSFRATQNQIHNVDPADIARIIGCRPAQCHHGTARD